MTERVAPISAASGRVMCRHGDSATGHIAMVERGETAMVGGEPRHYCDEVFSIPAGLVTATSNREGRAGRRWLDELPSLVARILDTWDCDVDGEALHGEMAIVVPVRRAEGSAALKVSFPHAGSTREAAALRRFDGHGAVRLIDADEKRHALLLERAGPKTLASLSSTDEAIDIAGHLARRLAVPAPADTSALAEKAAAWEQELERHAAEAADRLTSRAIASARHAIRALAADTTSTMLHGDLHLGNVLAASREPWLAIDPVGWRGTAAFDAFTVVAGRDDELKRATDVDRAIRARIRRYAAAAGVDAGEALALSQARATSSYLYQRLNEGDWFDLDLLRCMAEGLSEACCP